MPTSRPIPSTSRAVLDTNIIMDMLHFNDRHTQALLVMINDGRLQCFTDAQCLAELDRVTGYPEFGLDAPARRALMDNYRRFVTPCDAGAEENFLLPRCRDADDQKFLILAARSQSDLLITRDKLLLRLARHRHRPPPFAILTAQAAGQLLGLG